MASHFRLRYILPFLLTGNFALADASLCHTSELSIAVESPDAYAMETSTAPNEDHCLLLYPSTSPMSEAPARIDLKITSLKNKSLAQFIKSDFTSIDGINKNIEVEPDVLSQNKLTFKVRRAKLTNSEFIHVTRAYHAAGKQALVVTLWVRNISEIPLYEGSFRSFVSTLKKIPSDKVFQYVKERAAEDATTSLGKNFAPRFIQSILAELRATKKTCAPKAVRLPFAFRVSADGKIIDLYTENSGVFLACAKKNLLGVSGTKAPFGPFHFFYDFSELQ